MMNLMQDFMPFSDGLPQLSIDMSLGEAKFPQTQVHANSANHDTEMAADEDGMLL
jgi:hypothetical protein